MITTSLIFTYREPRSNNILMFVVSIKLPNNAVTTQSLVVLIIDWIVQLRPNRWVQLSIVCHSIVWCKQICHSVKLQMNKQNTYNYVLQIPKKKRLKRCHFNSYFRNVYILIGNNYGSVTKLNVDFKHFIIILTFSKNISFNIVFW